MVEPSPSELLRVEPRKKTHLSRGIQGLGTPRPGTEVSRALWARNPARVQKESERVSRRDPESPKSVARSPKRVHAKTQLPNRTLLRLFSDFGAHFLGFWARRARETLAPGRGVPNSRGGEVWRVLQPSDYPTPVLVRRRKQMGATTQTNANLEYQAYTT